MLIWHRQEIVEILQSRKLKVRDRLWLPWGPRNSVHPRTPVPVPNSCSEHPSTKAVRGLESCFLSQRETNLKEYKQSYQLTAEGLAVLLLLPPFPNLSNFPLRARCPFCVRYHSTQYLHWGPSGSRPRILWVPSPLWRVPCWGKGWMGKLVGRGMQTKLFCGLFLRKRQKSHSPYSFPVLHSTSPSPHWTHTQELVLGKNRDIMCKSASMLTARL